MNDFIQRLTRLINNRIAPDNELASNEVKQFLISAADETLLAAQSGGAVVDRLSRDEAGYLVAAISLKHNPAILQSVKSSKRK